MKSSSVLWLCKYTVSTTWQRPPSPSDGCQIAILVVKLCNSVYTYQLWFSKQSRRWSPHKHYQVLSKKITSEHFHSLRSEFQKLINQEWNSSEIGTKNCIFILFGVTSGITRRSFSDPEVTQKRVKIQFFAPNSLEFHFKFTRFWNSLLKEWKISLILF